MSDESEKPQPPGPANVKITVDDDVAVGMYSNLQVVGNNETEFVLDFAYILPNQGRGKVRSRVIMSPKHAKALRTLLDQRIADYERRFGEIRMPPRLLTPGGPGEGGLPN